MSNLRRMLIAKAMSKDSNKMGEEFCDADGKKIVTTLGNGEVLCWQQMAKLLNSDNYVCSTYGSMSDSNLHIVCGEAIWPSLISSKDKISVYAGHYYMCTIEKKFNTNQTTFSKYGIGKTYPEDRGISSPFEKKIDTDFVKTGFIGKYNYTEDELLSFRYCGRAGNIDYNIDVLLRNLSIYDITAMLGEGNEPLNTNVFDSLIWSEGSDTLGYTPYTSTPIPVIVNKGVLHYALTKEVRDYASKLGMLDALNEYCCEHKDMIAYINNWKYVIHSLVDTGYTSWLKGKGSEQILLDYYANNNTCVECKYKIDTPNNLKVATSPFGASDGFKVNAFEIMTPVNSITGNMFIFNNSQYDFTADIVGNIVNIDIKANIWKLSVNGNEYTKSYGTGVFTTSNKFGVFALYRGTASQSPNYVYISKIRVYEESEDVDYTLVPYYDTKSRTFGMLDTLDTNPKTRFHTSAITTGVFTWSLTDNETDEVVDVDVMDKMIKDETTVVYSNGQSIEYDVSSIMGVWNGATSHLGNVTDATDIYIGCKVTQFGNNSFRSCRKLKNLYISRNVTTINNEIEYGFLYQTTQLSCIKIDKQNSIYTSEGNAIIDISNKKLIGACKNTIIPNWVEIIGKFSFWSMTGISTLTIPTSIKTLEKNCLRNSSITTINYNGTMEQWSAITKMDGWKTYTGFSVVCTDGTLSNDDA